MQIPVEKIDKRTFAIREIITKGKLSMDDEARVETIRRRILAGASKVVDVMSADERTFLEDIGAEVRAEFQTTSPVFDSTLADDLMFDKSRSLIDHRHDQYLKGLLRRAQRFVLTNDAAIKVGETIRRYPEMLVEQGVFARVPFPTCWIEFPSSDFHETIVPGSSTPEADIRVGYLFHNDHVYVGAQRAKMDGAEFSPVDYHLHHPATHAEEVKLAELLGISRIGLDAFYWGGTMANNLPDHVVRGLRAQHGFSFKVEKKYEGRLKGDMLLGAMAGEVRNIIGLLLMINQPSGVLRYDLQEHRTKMTHRGNRILMSHSIITINLDKRSRPDRLFRLPHGTHASPAWHPVMDHWCNDRVSRTLGYSIDDSKTQGRGDHAHQWVMVEESDLRFVCSVCGGRRWRRFMKNGRGDRSKGTVSQERIIKTDRDVNVRAKQFA